MTAQHAQRQGRLAGHNVAASLGRGRMRTYKHRDLGFVVDLGGFDAAANPLGVRLTGVPAHVVARGYHLLSMPGNRVRTAVDWMMDALLPRQTAQLGLVRSPAVPLDSASPEVPQHGLGFPHAAAPKGHSSREAGRPGGSAEAASAPASSGAPSAAAEASGEGPVEGSPRSGAR
jgi:NADH dehydrogenase